MKKLSKLFCVSFCLLSLFACKDNKQQPVDAQKEKQNQIESYSKSMLSNPLALDKQKADTLITLCNQYVADYPEDTMSAFYLYKMSEVYANMQNCNKAIDCLNRLIQRFPNSNYVGAARFFKGVYYKEVCDNVEKSVAAFEEYMAKHPNSPRVEDAKRLMQMDTMQNPVDLINK